MSFPHLSKLHMKGTENVTLKKSMDVHKKRGSSRATVKLNCREHSISTIVVWPT